MAMTDADRRVGEMLQRVLVEGDELIDAGRNIMIEVRKVKKTGVSAVESGSADRTSARHFSWDRIWMPDDIIERVRNEIASERLCAAWEQMAA